MRIPLKVLTDMYSEVFDLTDCGKNMAMKRITM